MRRAGLVVLASLFACGTNTTTIPAGDFSGPTGLAIASLPDRDLLFIANQGANELRAIILCPNNPAVATCGSNEDQQFLPGPIRLFPGSILVGERPLRLAGVPLLTSVQPPVPHGAVLVAGLGVLNSTGNVVPELQVVDAANLLAASRSKSVAAQKPNLVPLPDPTVDVVAVDQPGTSVVAIVATQSSNLSTAALSVLNVTLGLDGLAQATVTNQCALDFAPTRLALIPGSRDLVQGVPQHVYVADGTLGGTPGGIGDGLVEVSVPAIPVIPPPPPPPALPPPPPACPVVRRIPASDPQDSPRRARPLKSIALNPDANPDANNNNNPRVLGGSFILGVTVSDPGLCADHGTRVCPPQVNAPAGALCVDQGMLNCGAGRIVMLSNTPGTGPSAVLDAPVAPGNPPSPRLPLQPLRPPAAAREVGFMGRATCPQNPQNLDSLKPPCTAVRVGTGTSTNPLLIQRALIGLASAEDGSTVFIDIDNKRFFDDLRETNVGLPTPVLSAPTLTPASSTGVTDPPRLAFAGPLGDPINNPNKLNLGWMNAGITRPGTWSVVWHIALPGLESVSGTLSRTAGGPITLTLPQGADLTPWITSPELLLGSPSTCTPQSPGCVPDFVRVRSYSTNASCADLAVVPTTTDIPILAVHPGSIDLQAVSGSFDPDPACFASNNVGGTFEVHAGETTAGGWMVLQGLDVLGRVPKGKQLIVTGPRFDYPLPLTLIPYPNTAPAVDIALSFTVLGSDPTFAGTIFDFTTTSGSAVTIVRDPSINGSPGFAGPILVYISDRHPGDEVVFTAIPGSNSLVETIPAQFGSLGSLRVFY